MTKKQDTSDYFSSYSKIYINDWATFRTALAEHTAAYSAQQQLAHEMPLITDKELSDALNGPYSPVFKEFLDAFLFIKRLNFAKRTSSEAIFVDAKKKLPDNPCNMADRATDPAIKKKTAPEEMLTAATGAEAERRLDQLDALFQKCYATFGKLHQAAYNEANKQFTALGLTLPEQERTFLMSDEPLHEIQRRFVDLSMELPKIKDHGLFFSYYFQLKLFICTYSVLSMQQQPHEEKDIKQILKEFKKIINICEEHEKKMIASQEKNIAGIIDAVKY